MGRTTKWGPAMVAPGAMTMYRQLVLTSREVDAHVFEECSQFQHGAATTRVASQIKTRSIFTFNLRFLFENWKCD
jgi:hypothetical protein